MKGINYNSIEAQTGFQVRNLIEDKNLALGFDHRYWMTLSIDKATEKKWSALSEFSSESMLDIWNRQIHLYFRQLAKGTHQNLICIWGIDNLYSFHAVVLSQHITAPRVWMDEWKHSRLSWISSKTNERVFGKMCEEYDSERNALPYLFHHHAPSVAYVRHRKRPSRKEPPLVKEIDALIKSLSLDNAD